MSGGGPAVGVATGGRMAPRGRGGFTLVELAVVVMIVGILAGLVVPVVQTALARADAAHLAADARTISLAAFEFLLQNGRFPTAAAYGTPPPEMVPYLPENFPFSYKGVQYRWYVMGYPNDNNGWRAKLVGVVFFDYSQSPTIANAMHSYSGPKAYWSPTYFYFAYPE